MNLYARLSDLKARLRIPATTTAEDARLLDILEEMSRAIDDATGRRFYSEVVTRHFDGDGHDSLLLEPPHELISVTTLKADADRDGTFEETLTVGTHAYLYPLNETPKLRIEINHDGSPPISVFPRGQRTVEVEALWGYSDEVESVGTTAEALDDSETDITMTAGHGLSPGDTIRIGTEDIYVSAVNVDTVTGVRAVNGTTAASHLNGAAVSRRRFPRPVEAACLLQAKRFASEAASGAVELGGGDLASTFRDQYPAIRALQSPYRRVVVA